MTRSVRVKPLMPPCHVRTPYYLRGKIGQIERDLGTFPNPEDLAYRVPSRDQPLHRVRFTMAEIWGENAENPDDILEAEIYAHWLEPADAP